MKFSKAKPKDDGTKQIDIAIPMFGYKNHISIDRKHGIIRRVIISDAAAHDGARLREGLIDMENMASEVWADTAYRSAANEAYLKKCGRKSQVYHNKPKGRPMPEPLSRGNATKSKIGARVEHVFAEQKDRMGSLHPRHRHRQGKSNYHHGEYGLQHETVALAR